MALARTQISIDTAKMPPFTERNDTAPNDLFDYNAGLDELLAETTEKDANASSANAANPSGQNGGTDDATLGLDEEIKVTRKRAPIAKLDENKLLSQAGIPKLRRRAKDKLKFKGKGHEFSDAARLLTFYQLWLDDLYPRAKFADALSIVEKLGHSKRMQVMRKEWVDEGKPRRQVDAYEEDIERRGEGTGDVPSGGGDDMDLDIGPVGQGVAEGENVEHARDTNAKELPSIFGNGGRPPLNSNSLFDDDDDEDLFVSDPNPSSKPLNPEPDSAAPEEDDLDALLAETEQNDTATGSKPGPSDIPSGQAANDDYDDDLEAMNMYGT